MPERWIGIIASSSNVIAVEAEVPSSGPLIIQADQTWPLQKGERASAYDRMHQQVADYIKENKIARAVIKSSAVTGRSISKAHLLGAEVRGVVICATASVTDTVLLEKAALSRKKGKRKVDDYTKDDDFWADEIKGKPLRKGSREAAFYLLACRDAK